MKTARILTAMICMLFFLVVDSRNLSKAYSVSHEEQIAHRKMYEKLVQEFRSVWEEWNRDPEFVALPYFRKCQILDKYLTKQIADLDFEWLTYDEQTKAKCFFIIEHLGSPDPGMSYEDNLQQRMCKIIEEKFVSYLSKVREKAEGGNANAQFELGSIIYKGRDKGLYQRIPEYEEAAKWFRKAAKQGHAEAQFKYGFMNDFIHPKSSLKQSCEEAAKWYRKAAEQGQVVAQRRLGQIYCGDQVFLCCPVKEIAQDYQESVKWFRMAAGQGDAEAQFKLGYMYSKGQGVLQDYSEAIKWNLKSAEQGYSSAQYNLGIMYYNGEGVPQDFVKAYAWVNLAAAQDSEYAEFRNKLSFRMTSSQTAIAQQLSAELQSKIDKKSAKNSDTLLSEKKRSQSQVKLTGTGFIITKDGYVLTCHHVVEGSISIKVKANGNLYLAKLISEDKHNDLALLKISGEFPYLSFSNHSALMGESVFTIGYPNPFLQGDSPKFTSGEISSLTGFQDDPRLYQISVPVQPGNSGGPLVDRQGNVKGIVLAILDARVAFQFTGAIPQNVNYAINSLYLKAMLSSLPEVSYRVATSNKAEESSFEEIVKMVETCTVMILATE